MELVYRLLRLNSLMRGHRLKFAAAALANLAKVRHLSIRLDPVMACNLRCQMCAFSGEPRKHNPPFTLGELEKLADDFFPLALQVVVGCGAEPTLHKECTTLIGMAKKRGVPAIGLVTNGQLLSESKLQTAIDNGLGELIVSLHGVRKDTYEKLMVNASYDRFLELLGTVKRLRAHSSASKLSLRLNYTVCPDNIEELATLFDALGDYHFNVLQVRPMFDTGGAYTYSNSERHAARYNEIVQSLRRTCQERGVLLLANTANPTYQGDGYSAVVLDAVQRIINPDVVWRSDFDWRNESYQAFCKRIGWSRHLLRSAMASRAEVVKSSQFQSTSLQYNIT